MEQPSHLTIKDIGVILERLSAKIVDVERLERDTEGATHNWTIKVLQTSPLTVTPRKKCHCKQFALYCVTVPTSQT